MSNLPAVTTQERVRIWIWMLIGVALFYIVFIHSWFAGPMMDEAEKIQELREKELALRLETQQTKQLKQLLATYNQQRNGNPSFMPEPNKELATASLLQRIEQVVTAVSPNGATCQISSRTPSESASQEKYVRAQVRVGLRCGTEQLVAVLHALETSSPQLFVDNLDLMSRRSYLGAAQEPSAGALDANFDLFGYLPVNNQRASNIGGRP
jgi:general secretion pathway protein M